MGEFGQAFYVTVEHAPALRAVLEVQRPITYLTP
jgi:hypothetical protein